ncbi:MAG TPA: hypothetical protein VMS71_02795, partial [Candidatus Acidoferrum sp.]|nr:hypothetical protein [Candidatus Acidoferrum sp.]
AGVFVAFVLSVASLTYLVVRTYSFRRSSSLAEPQGSALKGVVYAFGRGLMPWAKESASKHLATYVGGVVFHIAIAIALVFLAANLLKIEIPQTILVVVRIACALGLLTGVGLLVKRMVAAYVRVISSPDDFVANLLVDLFLAAVIITTAYPGFVSLLYGVAIVLALYIPLGKIRHCFFFFYDRILFGNFFGRRGVLPPGSRRI